MGPRKWARQVALCGVAIGGLALGAWSVPKVAGACDCAEPKFDLALRSVTSSNEIKSDRALWYSSAILVNYDTYIRIDFKGPGTWPGGVVGER
jgi:hypothetical protein